MEGDFLYKQPKLSKKYVLVEWDGVLNRNTKLIKPFFMLLKQTGVVPKVFTFRNENDDNSDLLEHFKKEEVLFSNGNQKRDVLFQNGIKSKEVAYWVESDFRNVVDKENLDKLSSLLNNGQRSGEQVESQNLEKPYVFLDWDHTMSLRPDFTERFFYLFKEYGFNPKVFTSRYKDKDNSDLLLWVNEEDIFFADMKQKKDRLDELNISEADVAFWLDDSPQDFVAVRDFYYLFSYYNG